MTTDQFSPVGGAPEWFVEAFRDAYQDLDRDQEDLVPRGTESEVDAIRRVLVRRATQLWNAVVAVGAAPSTAVDVGHHRPGHPYEPADTPAALRTVGFPSPAIPNDPNPRRVYAQVPGRDAHGNAVSSPLYVDREPADMRAPKIDCERCGGNGEILVTDGALNETRMCDTCIGTGQVTAPPTPPRDTGAVPDDHPLAQPLTDEERAAIAERPVDPNTAAAIAAVQARTDSMQRPRG